VIGLDPGAQHPRDNHARQKRTEIFNDPHRPI
jgi:hypothetical protein